VKKKCCKHFGTPGKNLIGQDVVYNLTDMDGCVWQAAKKKYEQWLPPISL